MAGERPGLTLHIMSVCRLRLGSFPITWQEAMALRLLHGGEAVGEHLAGSPLKIHTMSNQRVLLSLLFFFSIVCVCVGGGGGYVCACASACACVCVRR